MAYTEFCCRSGGHNLNAGTLDGINEPATVPVLTVPGCDYNGGGAGITMPVGTSMSEFVFGRYVSVCKDGDTAPTSGQFVIGRVQSVNAGTRTVTFGLWQPLGTLPSASSGWTVRIGGAWAGPGGTSAFPISLMSNGAASPAPRVNYKNDQTYSVTAAMTTVGDRVAHRGYAAAYGDGGRAVIDGGTTGAAYTVLTVPNANTLWDDLVFQNNGGTGGQPLVTVTGTENMLTRCAFGPSRGACVQTNGVIGTYVECEAFGFNQAGTNSLNAGFWSNASSGNVAMFIRCIAHDATSKNAIGGSGWYISGGTQVLMDCIGFGCSYGLYSASVGNVVVTGSDFYSNSLDGINLTPNASFATHYIANCNLFKNGGYGIIGSAAGTSPTVVQTVAFGSGTQANTSGDYVGGATVSFQVYDPISYPSGQHPWADPANGDFTVVNPSSKGRARGVFPALNGYTKTTAGARDLGAAQSFPGGFVIGG